MLLHFFKKTQVNNELQFTSGKINIDCTYVKVLFNKI